MHRKKKYFNQNFDSLLDTVANVVGILIIMLAVTQISVGDAVDRILTENDNLLLPNITQEDLKKVEKQSIKLLNVLQDLKKRWDVLEIESFNAEVDLDRIQKLINVLNLKLETRTPTTDDPNLLHRIFKLKERKEELKNLLAMASDKLNEIKSILDNTPLPKRPKNISVRLPEPNKIPYNYEPAFFICKNNRIIYLDQILFNKFLVAIKKAINLSPNDQINLNIIRRKDNPFKIVRYFKDHDIGTSDLKISVKYMELSNTSFDLIQTISVRKNSGESIENIIKSNSNFINIINSLNIVKNDIQFFVWPDSFPVYTKARHYVEDKLFYANWILLNYDEELSSSILFPQSNNIQRNRD